jgi:hypothetical protein
MYYLDLLQESLLALINTHAHTKIRDSAYLAARKIKNAVSWARVQLDEDALYLPKMTLKD